MAENILNYGKIISYMGCYQSKPLFHNLKKKKRKREAKYCQL